MNINHKERGFTIVELLIVIVVIGILAAITIVAYNGVQQRAKTNAAQSAASNAAKKADLYNADPPAGVSGYPANSTLLTGAAASTTYQLTGVTVLGSGVALDATNATPTTLTYTTCTGGGVIWGYWNFTNNTAASISTGNATGTCTRQN